MLLSACSSEKDVIELRLGHGLDMTHPVHAGMQFMADRVKELSDGEINITIYPSEQLGTERQTLELLQIGSLDITKVSAAVLENFSPMFGIFGVPFLFVDDDHMYTVLDGPVGQRILDSSSPYRIVSLVYYDAGARSFYTTKRPIHTPDDLRGLSIRVQESATSIRMVNTLGGSATPISWGELYTALQQGVVDGAENNPPSFFLSRHYEVAPYYTLNEHTVLPDILLISDYAWNTRLNERQREIVLQAARESVPYQRQRWRVASDAALAAVKEAGVEVIYPDREPFMRASEPLYERLRTNQPELYELFNEIREAANADVD
jgi:tripartite ATP-independent transporter DctP family solute receptor